MSLLTTFLANHLIPALEKSLESHEPEIQKVLLDELHTIGQGIATWVITKIEEHKQNKGE